MRNNLKNLFSRNRIQALGLSLVAVGAMGLVAVAEQGGTPADPAMTVGPSSEHGQGHGYGPGGKRHGGHHRCGAFKELNLTQEQKDKLKSFRETMKQENPGKREAMKARFQELRTLDKNDPKRVQMKAEMMQERKAMMAKHKAQLAQVLTPEQMKRLEAAKAKCKAERKEKNGDKK